VRPGFDDIPNADSPWPSAQSKPQSRLPSGVVLDRDQLLASHNRALLEVEGLRANATPARLTRVHLRYVVDGEGIDRANTLRAIELAVTKYCSVRDSLDKSIQVDWSLVLNGASD